ncbi:glucose PTS transporter subunit IIA [uncultured Ilyobacter sp.]|uniref:PTS sugar transporter subunit IIA n=1 Tax=uncultured Ilyobacter sp. TaxID=544433 RepID=UPI0029C65D46|nr:glucose PTS transporter subunit IIA [uncultured Ilyobacter sp.]
MGILSKLFGCKSKTREKFVEIYSPIDGDIVDLADVPDEAFACRAIGDGVAIVPSENGDVIHSPVDADDMSIFETNHAVSFESREGLEIIVHFGVDTVNLGGKGFERIGKEGSSKIGDKLVRYDLEYLKSNAKSVKTPVIISNMEIVEEIERGSGKVKAGELLMKVKIK